MMKHTLAPPLGLISMRRSPAYIPVHVPLWQSKDLGNSGSAFLNCGAVCILTSSCIEDIMEGPNLMDEGNSLQKRKFTRYQLAFYTFLFALIIASPLVSIVFCLLDHKQASESCWAHGELNRSSTQSPDIMRWNWKLEHCNGFVRKDGDQYLIIEHSGKYFIYAQLHRLEKMEEAFTLTLYKEPNITLNKAGGPIKGDVMATVNFARPFFLKKGDRLYCKENVSFDKIAPENQSYWGLFKM